MSNSKIVINNRAANKLLATSMRSLGLECKTLRVRSSRTEHYKNLNTLDVNHPLISDLVSLMEGQAEELRQYREKYGLLV